MTILSDDFNAEVTIMVIMWDMETGKQGGRGVAVFVGSMNSQGRDYILIVGAVSAIFPAVSFNKNMYNHMN